MTSGESRAGEREHLFISYAWEDGALAEWLTLRLTAEGFAVWCDRFKLLGGESWPADIDDAIKNRTFRMLHLLSAHSLRKENPTKERQLALALQRERKEEILIPLNVDGTKPTELNWQLSDITYIPFQDWGAGLKQLLEKLEKAGAPKPRREEEGRVVAGAALLPPDVLRREKEELHTNWFPFVAIPQALRRFTARPTDTATIAALGRVWPTHRNGSDFYSLVSPPKTLASMALVDAGGVSWRDVERIDGLSTRNLVVELLNKFLFARCLELGLCAMGEGPTVYFPAGLVQSEQLRFPLPNGTRSRVRVLGRRRSGGSHFHYHLGFLLRTRQGVGNELVAQLKLRLHVTDGEGHPVSSASAFRRGTRVRRGWWNRQHLLRQCGVMEFLSAGSDKVVIWPGGNEEFSLSRAPLHGEIAFGIDENALALVGDETEAMDTIVGGEEEE